MKTRVQTAGTATKKKKGEKRRKKEKEKRSRENYSFERRWIVAPYNPLLLAPYDSNSTASPSCVI